MLYLVKCQLPDLLNLSIYMADKTIGGCVRTPRPEAFCRDDWTRSLSWLRACVHLAASWIIRTRGLNTALSRAFCTIGVTIGSRCGGTFYTNGVTIGSGCVPRVGATGGLGLPGSYFCPGWAAEYIVALCQSGASQSGLPSSCGPSLARIAPDN